MDDMATSVVTSNNNQSDAPITRVTVFQESALITRTWTKFLQLGVHHLRFNNFTQQYITNSLRVKVSGSIVLHEVGDVSPGYSGNSNKSIVERRELEKGLEKQKSDFSRQLDFAEKRLEAWEHYRQVILGRSSGPVPSIFKEGAVVDLHDFLWKYEDEYTRVQSRLVDTRESYLSTCEQLEALISHIPPKYRRVSDIKVVLEAPVAGNAFVEISYMVEEAGWIPRYDMRFVVATKQVDVLYHADIQQWTGEDWTDATVTIATDCTQSTGNTTLNGDSVHTRTFPVMSQNPGSSTTSSPNKAVDMSRSGSSETLLSSLHHVVHFSKETERKLQHSMPAQEMNHTTKPFSVQLHDIHSIGHEKSVSLLLGKLKLDAVLHHSLRTNLSQQVQIKATVLNQSSYTLLKGSASLYLDGNHVGNTVMDIISPLGEFELDLGMDPEVEVTFQTPIRTTKPIGATTDGAYNIEEERTHEYNVKNNRRHPITVTVLEYIPKTHDERIKVTTLFPKVTKEQLDSGLSRQIVEVAASTGRSVRAAFKYDYPQSMRHVLKNFAF